ncbi:MAG: outer membrane protein assembly factor [Chitinivibrionia bacterium]|nr:outer membrane protein assembly factor [Chitinivibrionia bacterium]
MKNIKVAFLVIFFFLSVALFADDTQNQTAQSRDFSLSGFGGALFPTIYGENRSWLWVVLQFKYKDFLREGQHLYFDVGAWQDRHFGTTMHIPLGASNYFFDIGGLVGRRPSLVFEEELSPYLNTFTRFGRNISERHRVCYEIAPRFRRYSLMSQNTRGDWLSGDIIDEFWEVYQRLQYRFRLSDNLYPPMLSTFAQISLNTNIMLAFENVFWGISGELSQNIPVSYRARQSFLLRTRFDTTPIGERHRYGGFLTGGAFFVRGWNDNFIGSRDSVNFGNRIVGTAEYQFYIATLPEMRMGAFSWVDHTLSGFRPVMTGALFLDAGYLFETFSSPRESINANAASAGIAIRLLQPRMRSGASLDFAWQISGTQKYLNKNRNYPVVHLGFVQHF